MKEYVKPIIEITEFSFIDTIAASIPQEEAQVPDQIGATTPGGTSGGGVGDVGNHENFFS